MGYVSILEGDYAMLTMEMNEEYRKAILEKKVQRKRIIHDTIFVIIGTLCLLFLFLDINITVGFWRELLLK